MDVDLMSLLEELAPASVLAVGADAERRLAAAPRLHAVPFGPGVDPHATLEALSRCDRHDLGVVSVADAGGDAAALEPVVARLRDVQARRLWVLWPESAGLGDDAGPGLAALGLQPLAECRSHGEGVRVLAHDVATYKRTPDWLNPSGWAHPERWDKDRW